VKKAENMFSLEEIMKTRILFTTAAVLSATIGCIGYVEPGPTVVCVPEEEESEVVIIEESGPDVDTWVSAPIHILELIEPYTFDYMSPPLYRYSEYLYDDDVPYDPDNLPCYVRADFNGDYEDDYAFLFSRDTYYDGAWDITTKMIVVLSDGWDYEVAYSGVLGTVTTAYYEDIEEFWAISWLERGEYTVISDYRDATVEVTLELENDAVFLASLDPADEAVYYAVGDEVLRDTFGYPDEYLAKKGTGTKKSLDTYRKEGARKSMPLEKIVK
jgi:hypothetical protein